MMKNKKLVYGVIILMILLSFSFVVWTRYEVDLQIREKPNKAGCTLEAKICPDGSAVGRNPNKNCEFDPCPPYVFDKSKFCPDTGDCQDFGFESRLCRVIDDCVASCAYGCVTKEWLRGREDCEAMWPNFECECINNICQRKVAKHTVSCGGWDTFGDVVCECNGQLAKQKCPTNVICDSGTDICYGICGECKCYQGPAKNGIEVPCNGKDKLFK